MIYTYDDFVKKATEAGMLEQFSDADLKLAQSNPDAGVSILEYKMDYAKAPTAEAKALANAGAEKVRKTYGNYTGGTDGSGFKVSSSIPTPASFTTKTSKPTYSYNALEDPIYQTYKDVYTREGERAAEDTLGRAAQQTGGMASSYAVTAAAAQQQEAAKKIADVIPELEAQAYGRYQNEVTQYNNDRNFDYGKLLDQIGFAQNEKAEAKNAVDAKLSAGVNVSDDELAEVGYTREYADSVISEKNTATAKEQVNWWLGIGIMPSDELLKAAGMGDADIAKLKESNETTTTQETLYERMYAAELATVDGAKSWLLANEYATNLDVATAIAEGYISEILPKMKETETADVKNYVQMLNVAKYYTAAKLQEEIAFAEENGYDQWYISELRKLLATATEAETAALNGGSV